MKNNENRTFSLIYREPPQNPDRPWKGRGHVREERGPLVTLVHSNNVTIRISCAWSCHYSFLSIFCFTSSTTSFLLTAGKGARTLRWSWTGISCTFNRKWMNELWHSSWLTSSLHQLQHCPQLSRAMYLIGRHIIRKSLTWLERGRIGR